MPAGRIPGPTGEVVVGSSKPSVGRGAIMRRALGLVGVLLVVFGIVLPRLVDEDAVRAALVGLTPWQLTLLAAASVAALVVNAGPYRVLVPGLSWRQATGSDLAARAVATTVPGPTDHATRLALYRQWSIPGDVASAGVVLAGLVVALANLALPAIALVGVLASDQPARVEALPVALIGLVILGLAAMLITSIVRSESLARRLGTWFESIVARIWTVLRKTPPSGIVDAVLELRRRSTALLTERGVRGFAAAVAGKLAWFVVLEVALWCVGVGPDVLPPSAVLATMGIVGIVALVPLTPGGVGVSEVAYIGILTSMTGPGLADELTAAVTLYRIAQWLVPIPIGWVLLLVMRRGHWADVLGPRDGSPVPAPSTP